MRLAGKLLTVGLAVLLMAVLLISCTDEKDATDPLKPLDSTGETTSGDTTETDPVETLPNDDGTETPDTDDKGVGAIEDSETGFGEFVPF